MAVANPFTEHGRITNPERFVGRWRELSLIFDQIDARKPVMVAGVGGIGRSSLLTHIVQSASTVLEQPTLEAIYVDMAVLPNSEAFFSMLTEALGNSGAQASAFEFALLEQGVPVLLALDNAQHAIEAGWGDYALESLARIERRSTPTPSYAIETRTGAIDLIVVVAVRGSAIPLSEPFVQLTLGAFASSEVRLLAEAYLFETGVSFEPRELNELWEMSKGHPAYLQRAAFHLYRAKTEAGYDWRAAYRAELRENPLPDAPLPPGVFEGGNHSSYEGVYEDEVLGKEGPKLDMRSVSGVDTILGLGLSIAAGLLAWQLSTNLALGALVLLLGVVLVLALQRKRGSDSQ
jgi:hypothetical protein